MKDGRERLVLVPKNLKQKTETAEMLLAATSYSSKLCRKGTGMHGCGGDLDSGPLPIGTFVQTLSTNVKASAGCWVLAREVRCRARWPRRFLVRKTVGVWGKQGLLLIS